MIDDRRIKVDFSQSVSRLEEQRPQRGFPKSSYGEGLERKTKYRDGRTTGNEYGLVFDAPSASSDRNRNRDDQDRRSPRRESRDRDRSRDRSIGRNSRREAGRSRERDKNQRSN